MRTSKPSHDRCLPSRSLVPEQVAGAVLVLAGVVTIMIPTAGSISGAVFSADPKYVVLCLLSAAFPSLATIVKEGIFKDAKEQLGGRQLDIFCVNTFGSAAQVRRWLSKWLPAALCVVLWFRMQQHSLRANSRRPA